MRTRETRLCHYSLASMSKKVRFVFFICRLLFLSLLIASVMAEPNAVIKVLIKPFQNRTWRNRCLISRDDGFDHFLRDRS